MSREKKLKIGFFTDTYSPSINGVVTSILSFKKELEKLGHEVYVFAPEIPGAPKHERRTFRFPSAPSLAYPEVRESLPLSPKILYQIPKLKLDILHIQTPGQIGLLGAHLAIRYDLPAIFSYHTHYPEYFSVYKKATASLIMGMLAYPMIIHNPRAYKELLKLTASIKFKSDWRREIAEKLSMVFSNQTDGVIAPSPKIRNLLLKWGVVKTVAVIPTGIDLAEFKNAKNNYKKVLGLKEDAKLITYMGRVGQEKNIDLLLDAFAKIHKKLPSTYLIITSDGPHRKTLMKKAEKLHVSHRTIFTGYLKREVIPDILKSSNLFVFPSVTDTQGIAVLEAAACGLPIILVDKEITEVLVQGKNGYYSNNNVTDLGRQIMKMMRNDKLRQEFSKNSKKYVKNYTSSKLVLELVKFYKKVIDEKK